ncbi:polyprotein [Plakobranchus ocellatus]|uniref:Polyprotein n=1 Tax=Plakobranchus ocellatus TaxID=259542 RepID=A0AAV4AQP8_9GAST|nr:polyprotein [Plakobranchus ocellatus]
MLDRLLPRWCAARSTQWNKKTANRREFPLNISKDLILPQIERRRKTPKLTKQLTFAIDLLLDNDSFAILALLQPLAVNAIPPTAFKRKRYPRGPGKIDKLKARHSALSRAESARKKRSQKWKNQERFIRGAFQFARQLFQQPKSGSLTVNREELETHLKKTYSDPTREIPLEEITGLVWPAAPGIKFDSRPPSLQEVIAVVNKARAKSAPGPSGVPYLLYKRCPNVLKKYTKYYKVHGKTSRSVKSG